VNPHDRIGTDALVSRHHGGRALARDEHPRMVEAAEGIIARRRARNGQPS
jgi:hypothetical protein